ncbi:disease resistance protein RUN1-like [Juglans regia]|uniref:Disease resistance protein RUN1-like n=1 Tax=Juglans regia TaxID=51240 RepID=A0A6P9EDW6_JUGRE|nr:disease resistance protein RUN1-like [Juglans regia]XP_035546431.1 disease resistance protein RUN1-like [Juglans regia]
MTSSNESPEVLSSDSSSNSSSLTSQWSYDVFLSFRGEDTRYGFISHLYSALHQKGINTYMDDKLRRGEEISPTLLKAIKESKISIVVFSENYASSIWCLNELIRILECKESKQQKVLPVFYKVEPSTVRLQKNSFKEALAKHEDRFKDDAKVQRWKTALKQAADISGLHLKINEDESKFIQKILQEVSKIVLDRTYLHVAEYPVGIDSRVEDINKLLCIKENETCMIGIFGIGGIGKTTIAKEMYNRITDQFEGSCFLANVRESSKQDQGGLVKLQEKILDDILKDSNLKVDNVDRGINLIMERLCGKRILLVIDDVDSLDQLEKLCGRCDWFGSGSRIIITTRNAGLLNKHCVSFKFRMKEMDHGEALKLFSKQAFKSGKPDDGFAELTKLALYYAGGLPLALKVVGSNLYGEDIHYWKSELEKYKRIPEENIQEKLKISYDGLNYYERKIFLDIAYFFKGDKREYVTKILDGCGFFPNDGIKKLNDKCLITIDQYDRLWMHDLLQDMGREIVRQESPEEPGKRSRLYFHEDVHEVLEKNKGTEQIEGILIDLPRGDHMIRLGSEVFAKMEKQRILIIRSCGESFCGGLNYLSNELRVIDWLKCPLESLPSTFDGKKLIILKMRGSMIRDLGMGLLSKNLTIIDFSESKYLTKIPDLSSCSNLEKLILFECKSLVEVHDSVGFLDKLVVLSFDECPSLKNLPRSFKLRSLEVLELLGCTSLENFPEIECEIKHLKWVRIESDAIQELPSSITYLTGLVLLLMSWCESLVHLPIDIFQLEHLSTVTIRNCPKFVNFGKEVGQNGQSMPSIQENEISSSMELFPLLPPKSNLPRTFNFSSSLRYLRLSSSGIVRLPPFIERVVGLSWLDLEDCKQLEEILHLPPNIEYVNARGCVLLERFPHVSTESSFGTTNLKWLRMIDLTGCNKVQVNVGNHAPDPLLLQERFREKDASHILYPGSRIPEWFKYCKETTSYTNSIEVEIDHNASISGHQIVALVLCFVIKDEFMTILINGELIGNHRPILASKDPHRVWLLYIAGNSIDEMLSICYREGNDMRFTFESDSKEAILKSAGVHLIYRNDNFIDPI